jgi:predicted esterase
MALMRILLLALLALAAGLARADDFLPDQLDPRVDTPPSTEQQNPLYLPPGYDATRKWPVLILLDPRGRAEESLALAVEGARRHGWIVMSSYQSRSDTLESTTLYALQALLDESEKRFSTERRRLYLAGMSGTAKTLWKVVEPLRGSLAGMIGCAGGRPSELGKLAVAAPPFYGCTGRHDFNHREMLDLEDALAAVHSPQHLQEFAGGHGWPTQGGLGAAIDWLELSAMRTGLTPRRADWIASHFADARQAAEAESDDYRRWRALRQVLADHAGLLDTGDLAARVAALEANAAVRAGLAREKQLREDERRYAGLVDTWATRMRARFPDGRPQAPPGKPQSLSDLKVRSMQKLAASADPAEAESASRRLELAYAAAAYYLPAEAMQRREPGHAAAARAVAAAIFPDRAEP